MKGSEWKEEREEKKGHSGGGKQREHRRRKKKGEKVKVNECHLISSSRAEG